MKRSKFAEAQIAFALKQVERDTNVEEVCRIWGKPGYFLQLEAKIRRFGSELSELRQLKEENARLKRPVADLGLDKEVHRDVIEKKR